MEEFMLKSRRSFLKQASLGVLGVGSLSSFSWREVNSFLAKSDLISLTILHTNDMHSRVESFPENHRKYPGQGGIVNVGRKIAEIRKQEPELLLLDAGDIFQGTPYFNEFGGELEFKLMSFLKYDCATIGNHDFDNGLEGFDRMLKHAEFPFANANYNFTNTILEGKIKPYKIIRKKGLKIGVFGVGVELEGLVSKENYLETKYEDPISKANEIARLLKEEEKCNLIVCLSHLGYSYKNTKVCDKDLAEKTSNIDLIIGGHTHTFLEKAQEFKNAIEKKVLVNQAGWSALNLGRVDFVFSKKENKILAEESAMFLQKNYANI